MNKKGVSENLNKEISKKANKRAQAWGFDLMIASVIFIAGVIAFYFYALNTPETETRLNSLAYDGDIIASALLSEGFPENWNSGDVITPGILTDDKINDTKLESFNSLAMTNYAKTKALFNTNYDYYIYLSDENFTISGSEVEGIGNLPSGQDDLIKISRVVIYENRALTLNIEVWE